ncbi:MAG TPA: formate dehydrogenase subunit gamma, partial [Acidimicrobiales bacterium]|nr:formate dehydrogenase subunit gamma [Acidimicrobiales bacterium]
MVDLDQHGPAFPGGPAFSEERIVALVEQRRHLRGPLLEILHAIDDELGFVDERVIPILARELNLSRAEVHGVVTFYRDFRTEPPPAHTLRLCRAEACQSMGAERLVAHAEASLGTRVGGRTADGAIGLEQVFCLGNCALSPAALLDGRLVGRVDEARLDALVARVRNTDREEPGSSAAPPSSRSDRPGRRGTIVYVPRDAAAGSVGADEVADVLARGATARGLELSVVRNGSRGMFWLEPLVEVATPSGRVAYGPVDPGRVDELLDAGLLEGAPHELFLGATDELPWLARQTRLTFCRVGVTDPLSPEDYEEHGGLAGLRKALAMDPGAIVDEVTASGLRGRGGAGFPAGIKWSTVQNAPTPDVKFVCCNADEGDSGTFADRMLLEGDPFLLVEGMTIAGLAVGAVEGYLYVRSEYPEAVATMRTAIEIAYLRGWLGEHVLGSDRSFDLSLR